MREHAKAENRLGGVPAGSGVLTWTGTVLGDAVIQGGWLDVALVLYGVITASSRDVMPPQYGS